MKTRNRKRSVLLTFGVVLIGLSLACVVWVKHEQQQYALNRRLIAALKKDDFKQALALVEAGADPNTRLKPMLTPSFSELVKKLLHHSPPEVNDSLTAFMIVCGFINTNRLPNQQDLSHEFQRMELAQRMLVYGANINARAESGMTALMWASSSGLTNRMTFLLTHGAIIDLQDDNGQSALYLAVHSYQTEGVGLLLKYHANPNLKDGSGHTPLWYVLDMPEGDLVEKIRFRIRQIIPLLKSAGAKE